MYHTMRSPLVWFSFALTILVSLGSLRAAESDESLRSAEKQATEATEDRGGTREGRSADAPSQSSSPPDPRHPAGRIFAEFGMGAVGVFAGVAVVGGGAYATCRLAVTARGEPLNARRLDGCLALGALFGGPAAAAGLPTGVLLGGRLVGGRGEAWAPYVGVLGGLLVGGSFGSLFETTPLSAIVAGASLFAGPIVAYEWSHARVVYDEQRRRRRLGLSLAPVVTLDRRGRLHVGVRSRF
jgi:hypothetical protein